MSHGYRVSLGSRQVESLQKAHGVEDDQRLYAEFDALEPDTAERWVASTVEKFGRIDALVNNAGSAEQVTLHEENDEALDRLWEINVKALTVPPPS